MNLISADKDILNLLCEFIQPYEQFCVSLASHLRKQEKDVFILTAADSPDICSVSQIWGIFYLNKTLLHCLPFVHTSAQSAASGTNATQSAAALLKDFLSGKEIKSIIGLKAGTEFLSEILSQTGKDPQQINQYLLLTLDESPLSPPEALSCDDEIKRCHDNDFELLFDLQKKYLAKEVAPANRQVTDLECSASLKQILKNQLAFALYSDGELVAKANTNAIGINWVQLGGVYTHPLYRRNYYAWHLVYTLAQRIIKTGRKVVLFVKLHNNPALNLYKRIGFSEKEAFTIYYY